jgi:hypothetical protein
MYTGTFTGVLQDKRWERFGKGGEVVEGCGIRDGRQLVVSIPIIVHVPNKTILHLASPL